PHAVEKPSELFKLVDAVVICPPNKFHADLYIEALNHGVHVLCEKPMALTTEDKDVEIPKHLIIASRLSKGKHQILVKDYEEIENAEPLKHIDAATKIIMRGEE
ncbi:Gfo/Idh/MocA family oxidoreductase, partial [Staphylococcus aureus]|uniref:Gfo/Idh/MocA family oxidoreductase n=1 Tax=Staphylococcus aureus TaxID=1280 RepID=UPI00210DB49C